jgi:hypothetical protein
MEIEALAMQGEDLAQLRIGILGAVNEYVCGGVINRRSQVGVAGTDLVPTLE